MYAYCACAFLGTMLDGPAEAERRLPGVVVVGVDEGALDEVLVLGKLLLNGCLQLDVPRILT